MPDPRAESIGKEVLKLAREDVRDRVVQIVTDEASHWPSGGTTREILDRMAQRILVEVDPKETK